MQNAVSIKLSNIQKRKLLIYHLSETLLTDIGKNKMSVA